jgi:beta-glucosidase
VDVQLDKQELAIRDSLTVSFTLTNKGDQTAPEVAQLYLSDLQASTLVPRCHLIGFERVTLAPGQTRRLEFTITPEMMSFINDDGQPTLEPGQFRLEIGGCAPSPRGQELGAPKPITVEFTLS